MTSDVRAALVFGAGCLVALAAGAQQPTPTPTPAPEPAESFYATSLHATSRGIAYLYAKEQGGLELLTGLTADEMGCLKGKCHVRNCDTCHRVDVDGKAAFTTDKARIQQACDNCHPVDKDDPDVHVRRGMRCVDCHSAREVHGDGTIWNSARQPGVIDTTCERCHATLSQSASHTAHGGKLACQSCHTREFVTCLNCHIEAWRARGKETAIPVRDILFLVNHDGRVTTGNLLSYVYKGRTMITIAPAFSHSIQKEGLRCADCHGSANVKAVAAGTFAPFRWENGAVTVTKGVVPVLDGMAWTMPFLEREGDAWVPIADPPKPLVTFAGFSSPLSREQLARLEAPRGR